VLNGFGALMSLKHSERSHLHSSTGNAYRTELSKLFESTEFVPPERIRRAVHDKQKTERPVVSAIPLHRLWMALHALLAALAIVMVIVELTIGRP
jgi:hypothetical protein